MHFFNWTPLVISDKSADLASDGILEVFGVTVIIAGGAGGAGGHIGGGGGGGKGIEDIFRQ